MLVLKIKLFIFAQKLIKKKKIDRSIKEDLFVSCGRNMVEIAVWWNGLGKELEVDLESQEENNTSREF